MLFIQSLSHVQLFETSWTKTCQASLSFTISWSLFKPTSIESVMPSNHLILYRPLVLLPSIFPSIRVFSNKSASGGQSTGASTSALSSNECSGLISFRIDWFDLPVFQGTLSSLLQHHNSKASVLPMNIQDWFPLGYWFDLLAVQRTLKSLLQHHSSKPSILQHSAFLMVQLSHP